MTERRPVSADEALAFLGEAFRNVEVPSLDERDVEDVRAALDHFARGRERIAVHAAFEARATTPENLHG